MKRPEMSLVEDQFKTFERPSARLSREMADWIYELEKRLAEAESWRPPVIEEIEIGKSYLILDKPKERASIGIYHGEFWTTMHDETFSNINITHIHDIPDNDAIIEK